MKHKIAEQEGYEILDEVEYVIQATSYEKHTFWAENEAKKPDDYTKMIWHTYGISFTIPVGIYHGDKVCISVMPDALEKRGKIHRLAFWTPASNTVNYPLIEKWLTENLNPLQPNGLLARTNAWNFHHALIHCERTS